MTEAAPSIKTVRVASDHPEHGGYIVINADDLADHHVLFDDRPKTLTVRRKVAPKC